jgi:hypothetical protein
MKPKYRRLPVLELRKAFGIGWRVWIQSLESQYADKIPGGNLYTGDFSVPSQAGLDDLLLIYRPLPDGYMGDIVRVASTVEKVYAPHKGDDDWMADYQRVAQLRNPLDLDDLAKALRKRRKQIGRALHGRPDVSEYWPALRRLIVTKNPHVRGRLARYGPSRTKGL